MIKKYTWNDSIVTGVPEIDLQHKQFFAVLHDFADDLDRGAGADGLKKLLVFLKYYGEWHFGREEMCAQSHRCPLFGAQVQAHQKYVEMINFVIAQCRHKKPTEALAHSVYKWVTEWLVNHILKLDKETAIHVRLCPKNTRRAPLVLGQAS